MPFEDIVQAEVYFQGQRSMQAGVGTTEIPGTRCELVVAPCRDDDLFYVYIHNHAPFRDLTGFDAFGCWLRNGYQPKMSPISGSRKYWEGDQFTGWTLADRTDAVKSGTEFVEVPGRGRLAYVVGPVTKLWEDDTAGVAEREDFAEFLGLRGKTPAETDSGRDDWNHYWQNWGGDPLTSFHPAQAPRDRLSYKLFGQFPGTSGVGAYNSLRWGGTIDGHEPYSGNNNVYENALIGLSISEFMMPPDSDRRKICKEIALAEVRRQASLGIMWHGDPVEDKWTDRTEGMSRYEKSFRKDYIPGGLHPPYTSHSCSASIQWWAHLHPDGMLTEAAEWMRKKLLEMPLDKVWGRQGIRPVDWHLRSLRAAFLITDDEAYRARAGEFIDWVEANVPVYDNGWEQPAKGVGSRAPYREMGVHYELLMWEDQGVAYSAQWQQMPLDVFKTLLSEDLGFPYQMKGSGDHQYFRGTKGFAPFCMPTWTLLAETHAEMRPKLVKLFDAWTKEVLKDGTESNWLLRGITNHEKLNGQIARNWMPWMVKAIESWR